jgi:glycosyltransferase involved in cell wall biosynthesis
VSGASEIIKDGENGFIFDFDKNKAKNLAQKMQILLDNPALLPTMAKNSYETVKNHSWNNFYKKFMSIMEV